MEVSTFHQLAIHPSSRAVSPMASSTLTPFASVGEADLRLHQVPLRCDKPEEPSQLAVKLYKLPICVLLSRHLLIKVKMV
jgi:hypothetical protein